MAVETSADLLAQLRDEVGFDVQGGDATLLGWLNSRHRRMVSESRCYRKRLVIAGGTVAAQSDYVVPAEVIEVQSVELGGVEFDRASRAEAAQVRNASAVFSSQNGEGLVSQGANAAGVEVLTVYPTPSSGGTEIALFAAVRAPELQVTGVGGGSTNSPVVPAEFFEALVHGAAVPGLRRTASRHGEADYYDRDFTDATERLRRQVRRRWNTHPSRVRVAWPG